MTLGNRIHSYDLTIGLPQSNLNGLAEPQLLMQAGQFQWDSIASYFGKPLSAVKTVDGSPIYATFYYVEIDFPEKQTISSFKLDDHLIFMNHLRHFKRMAIDGITIFGHMDEVTQKTAATNFDHLLALRSSLPSLRMCNVFISPGDKNATLKLTPPEGVPFSGMDPLSVEDHAYGTIVRKALAQQSFGLLPEELKPIDRNGANQFSYSINPDRDTNGAGLVYFANYVAFFDMGERAALINNSSVPFSMDQINHRSLRQRRIAYFANANLDDSLDITTQLWFDGKNRLGIRTLLHRRMDNKLCALSEAIKEIPFHD